MFTPWFIIMRMTVFQSSGVYPEPVRAVRAWQLLHWASTSAFPLASGMSFWAQAGSTEQRRAAAMKRYKWISIVSPRSRRGIILAQSGSLCRSPPGGLSVQSDQPAAERRHNHDIDWRKLPELQHSKSHEHETDVGAAVDGGSPHRVVERRKQHSDDGGVDPAQRPARAVLTPDGVPERQCANDEQKRRQEDRQQREQSADYAIRGLCHDGAKVRREGKKRARHGLCSAIAREENVVAHPTGRNDLIAKQWKHDVPASENQRTGPVEAVEDG